MGWTTAAVTSGAGEDGTADSNGALVAYGATRAGETDIYYQPVWRRP